jgi:membrane-bound lytic murein transglycosylase B
LTVATVIDALLVTLGLDASGFKKGSDEAQAAQAKLSEQAAKSGKAIELQEKKLSDAQIKRAKELDARSKTMMQGFSKIRNEALALFAVFTGGVGLKNFIANTIGAAAGLDRMSANLGLNAKELAEWQIAATHAGGTADGITDQIRQANSELSNLQLGGGNSDALTATYSLAARYGVDSTNILKDGNSLLMIRADILKKMNEESPAKGMEGAKQMAVNDGSYNLMKQGSAEVEKQRKAQSGLADEQAKMSESAEALRKEMDALANSFKASSVSIIGEFVPAMREAVGWMREGAQWLAKPEVKEKIGETTAKVLALVGNEDALDAVRAKEGKGWGRLRFGKKEDLEAEDIKNGINPNRQTSSGKINYGASKKTESTDLFGGLESKYKLPRGLLDSVWNTESGRGKNMLSPAGAMGHFQFMPDTAKQYGLKNPNDLKESAEAAAHMLSDLLKQSGGDLPKALAGYNWGQGKVQKNGMGNLPPETKNYIGRVMGEVGRANARAAANMPIRAAAAAPVTNKAGNTNTSTTEVKVNTINVQTQATDAPGIAKSIGNALSQYGFATQANTGLA